MDVECCRMLSRHFVHEPGNSTLHFAFFSIFALFAFYLGFLFLKQLHESRRQPLIYRPGYILVVLLVYLSIHEYHKCIVEFWRCRILALELIWLLLAWLVFIYYMRGSSRLLISLSVLLGLLDRIVMQGSEKRIVGYICNACQRHFESRFAYEQHRRSRWLIGTPCFSAVQQHSELVATRRANMSTAMLRMSSLSRDVGNNAAWHFYVNYAKF